MILKNITMFCLVTFGRLNFYCPKSKSKGELTFTHPAIHAKETTLMCSRNATFEDFRKVKIVLESGVFPTDSFITHRVHFTEMIANFDSWLKQETGVIKAMVSF